MRNHRPSAILVTMTMILSLISAGVPLGVAAQDTSIQPIEGGERPAEIVVEGQRYLRDLDVPADLNPMQQLTDESGATVFVKPGESDPLKAAYVPLDDGSGLSTRYYPEFLGQAGAVCPVELSDAGTLSGNGATYVAAGPETDFTQDALNPVGTTDGNATIYSLPGDEELTNLFVGQNQGQGPNSLVRYVLQTPEGAPASLANPLTFGGQQFNLTPGAIASLDGLVRVGCAGLFPAYASAPDQPFTTIALDFAGQAVSYEAVQGEEGVTTPVDAPATAIPTEEPGTPLPTEAPVVVEPTVEPTLEPTPEPTVEPTPEPTPEPTAEPTPEPTAEPTAEPTPEPTAEPTAEPTLEPTAEPSPEPTAEPTVEPTAEPTPDPTAEPTAEPTPEPAAEATQAPTAEPSPEPTPAPTVEPTVAADADLGEVSAPLPTAVPPTLAPDVPTPTPAPVRPTPTPQPLQPQAVVPTLPPDVPSPAAGQSSVIACAGIIGTVDDNGVPERLPRNLQYGGTAYRYTGQVGFADAGELTATGCVGPFVLYLPAADAGDTNIYLGLVNDEDTVFVFEQTVSLTVNTQTRDDEQPRSLQLQGGEDTTGVRYRATDPWLPSLYSSLSLEIYVADPEAGLPDRFLGYSVGFDVFGEYVREGEAEGASQEVLDRAESLGVHQELVLDDQRYVLVALWTPFGTTTNGWLTLYSVEGETQPSRLIGLDPRRQDLLVFNAE